MWECKFKLTKNNGQRIHSGRFDVTDKDIQAIPSSYDTIPSTAFYKYPKDSDIVSLGTVSMELRHQVEFLTRSQELSQEMLIL